MRLVLDYEFRFSSDVYPRPIYFLTIMSHLFFVTDRYQNHHDGVFHCLSPCGLEWKPEVIVSIGKEALMEAEATCVVSSVVGIICKRRGKWEIEASSLHLPRRARKCQCQWGQSWKTEPKSGQHWSWMPRFQSMFLFLECVEINKADYPSVLSSHCHVRIMLASSKLVVGSSYHRPGCAHFQLLVRTLLAGTLLVGTLLV